MTQYFPKMRIMSYALGCGIPILLILIWWFGFGGTVSLGNPVGFVLLAVLIFAPMLSFNYFNRKAERELDSILSLYNEQCDPAAFLEEGTVVANNVTEPYSSFDSWFLSFYAMALLDEGRDQEAVQIGKKMQEFAESTPDSEEKANYLVNILPLVIRLFGADAGMDVVDSALAIVQANPTPNSSEQENYLLSQKRMIEAVINHDAEYLIQRAESIRNNDTGVQQMRVRVLEAEKEAQLQELLGDSACARECWRFVLENGNKLPCVAEAQKHLS